MKRRNKILQTLAILSISPIVAFTTACTSNSNAPNGSGNNNSTVQKTSDKQDVKNYVATLNPVFKYDPSQYEVSYFDTEQKIQDNFNGLPKSHNKIEVQFIDAKEGINSQTLVVRYLISQNDYSFIYSFSTSGFKTSIIINHTKIVEDYIATLKPTLKTDQQSKLPNILASSIKTQSQVDSLFDGLPMNSNSIIVEFVSSNEIKSGTLQVKFIISSSNYSKLYEFSYDGFKIGQADLNDKNTVLNYAKTINPVVRSGKKKQETLVESLNNESTLKEFYDGFPMNSNADGVAIEFVNSIDKGNGNLEAKFLLTKNDFSSLYVFNDNGFKINSLTDNQNYVQNYIKSINITPKADKADQIKNTYASKINTEEKLKQWFDGLPKSVPAGADRMTCQLVSAVPATNDSSILVLTYIIVKGNYSTRVSFEIPGFKTLDNNTNPSLSNFNDFSQFNAFRLRFGVENGKYYTEGTAWSWYVEKKSNTTFDWYLMTNLHVVDNVVADINGYFNGGNISTNNLRNYYKNNYVSTFPISDSKQPFQLVSYANGNKPQAIINVNPKPIDPSKPNYIPDSAHVVNNSNVKSIKIIHDFNNDNIELFSKTVSTSSKNYNLDMALVKISLDLGIGMTDIIAKSTRKPVFEKYLELNKQAPQVDSNNGVNISGIPYNQSKPQDTKMIMFNSISNVDPRYSYSNLLYSGSVLGDLRGPYYYMMLPENNFPLTGGASGSAVYQLEDPYNYVDYNKVIPTGIYWGHDGNRNGIYIDPSNTMPSFLPFVFNGSYNTDVHYNIWENFEKCLPTIKSIN